MNNRQCDPKGNISFPLQFASLNISNIPKNDPHFTYYFKERDSNKLNPKFEDNSRTSGGFLDESPNSLKINYNNHTYNLLSTQISLSTHSTLLGDDNKNNNKIDYILTLESDKDQFNNHLAPVAFIFIVIPLIIVSNDEIKVDNTYLGHILNYDISGNYSIETIFAGLSKFVWYETCLEPHGDIALAYVNIDGVKISENLYWNLLATWRKDSPYDIKNALTTAVTNIKKNIKDFCVSTESEKDVNILDNSINSLQASIYVPKVNKRIETWSRFIPPYDIVLNVQSNPVVTNSMEGFQVSPTVTGVYITETGGRTVPLSFPTGTPPNESAVLTELQRLASSSSAGQTIDLGRYKCVPLDMDGAIDSSGVHFDSMGQPLTDLYNQRNTVINDFQINKVSAGNLEIYFSYAIAALLFILIVFFFLIPLLRKTLFSSVTISTSALPSNFKQYSFYIIIGLIVFFGGLLLGAAVTSV